MASDHLYIFVFNQIHLSRDFVIIDYIFVACFCARSIGWFYKSSRR